MVSFNFVNIGSAAEWFVVWWHQGITWTNTDLPSNGSSGIHIKSILQKCSRYQAV